MVHLPSDDNIMVTPVEQDGSVRDTLYCPSAYSKDRPRPPDASQRLQVETELSKAQKKKQKKKAAAERKKTEGNSTTDEATPAGTDSRPLYTSQASCFDPLQGTAFLSQPCLDI